VLDLESIILEAECQLGIACFRTLAGSVRHQGICMGSGSGHGEKLSDDADPLRPQAPDIRLPQLMVRQKPAESGEISFNATQVPRAQDGHNVVEQLRSSYSGEMGE
jgi:hypothetical protein